MIYTVECAFTDPARENAWNIFYGGDKLTTLLALPGFRASQRFRAIMDIPAPYLAIHSIRDAAVLEQTVYRDAGGGTFSGWDDLVTNWDRNLFTGMEAAAEVSAAQCLVMCDDPAVAAKAAPGADFAWLDIAALDRTAARRGLAIVDRRAGESLAREAADRVRVFAPIADRQLSLNGIDS